MLNKGYHLFTYNCYTKPALPESWHPVDRNGASKLERSAIARGCCFSRAQHSCTHRNSAGAVSCRRGKGQGVLQPTTPTWWHRHQWQEDLPHGCWALLEEILEKKKCKSQHDYMCSVVESLCAAEQCHLQCPRLGATYLSTCQANGSGTCIICSDRARGIRKQSSFWCPECDNGVHWQCFHKIDHKQPR